MGVNKDEVLAQIKKQYDDVNFRWSRERDKFEADMQHVSADSRKEYEEKREEFRKWRKDLKEKIIDLEVASDNAWDDLKDGAENSWKQLSTAFDKATANFKK